MAETEPYSFEPMRDSSQSEAEMFTGVKMSSEEEILRGAMRVLCELGSYERMLMLQGNRGSNKQKFRLTTSY